MGTSFQRRRIRTTFRLATGVFTQEGSPDTLVLEGYRTQVEIDANGGYQSALCRVRIYGVDRFDMDRLSVINFLNLDFMRNSIQIEATDNDGQFTTIFLGEIYIAQPDYSGMPDVPLVIEAYTGLIGSLAPSAARSFPGTQSVSVMMGELAKELNLTLENNGVDTTLTDQYLSGSPLTKAYTLASIARIQLWTLPEQGVLAIAPMGVARQGDAQNVSYTTGLVGFPTKTHNGIMYTALFNPAVIHGGKILMESDVQSCNGEWYVISMNHRLDSELPGGAWFTHFIATPQNTTIRFS